MIVRCRYVADEDGNVAFATYGAQIDGGSLVIAIWSDGALQLHVGGGTWHCIETSFVKAPRYLWTVGVKVGELEAWR